MLLLSQVGSLHVFVKGLFKLRYMYPRSAPMNARTHASADLVHLAARAEESCDFIALKSTASLL